ncbi:unnamed protein product [Urochloa humidicola]
MTSVVPRVRNLVLYFDHNDFIRDARPKRTPIVEKSESLFAKFAEEQSSNRESTTTEHEGEVQDEMDDPDFIDSDYEMGDGDDDLLEDNVDKIAEDDLLWKEGMELADEMSSDSVSSTDEGLEFPNSTDDEGELKLTFKSFMPEDMSNPEFKVGMVFSSIDELREAISEYSIRNRVAINKPINDKKRIKAHCAEGCPWFMWASFDSRAKGIMVKTYEGKHTCKKEWEIKAFTAKYLAAHYLETFRADDRMSLRNFSRIVQKEFNMTPSRSKLGRAKRLAMKEIYGDEVDQYNKLWNYANELRRSNPGTTFYLNLDSGLFNTLYVALDGCKRGFLNGCRPLICLDGCHIKTKFGGHLLTAVGMDPNDCIFPVAMAVVEVECKASWKWFLQTLKDDLGILNTHPWTIMTDKQKGLIPAVREIFSDSEHRFCVRHLYQNFQVWFKGETLKNQLWACARSTSITQWTENMDKMKALNKEAYEWLEELSPNTWVRAFFSDFPKCDVLLNNNSEVFNKYILDARELPILSMIERIKCQLMTRVCSKQEELKKWPGTICPKIMKKVQKNAEFANSCYALPAGMGVFQVTSKDRQYIVDIKTNHCDCRKWDLTGIPCNHAISCLRHERIQPEDVVADCYSLRSFSRAYEFNIMPTADQKSWERMNGPLVKPPMYDKKVGRPKKCRRKQPHEVVVKGVKKMSKHGVEMHCSNCGSNKHNKRKCELREQGRPPTKMMAKKSRKNNSVTEERDSEDHAVSQAFVPAGPSTEFTSSQFSSTTMISHLKRTAIPPRLPKQHEGPLPECSFIKANQENIPERSITTATKEGKTKMKSRTRRAATKTKNGGRNTK